MPFSGRCWTPTITEYWLGSKDLQSHGEAVGHRQESHCFQNPRFTRTPRPESKAPGTGCQPTDLCKQCAAVRIHWWCTREPLQTYTPRNRMLTCQGHLPTSTTFPFTTRQDTLV